MDLFGDDWKEKDMPDLTGKVILVTGGTDGLGLAACKQLAINNAHVVFTYRNPDKLAMATAQIREAAPNSTFDAIEMELTSLRSVHEAAHKFLDMGLPLHVLINNAGIIIPKGQLGAKTKDGFEITYATNHFGHFYLTQLLLDKLKESAPSRIVWQSSAGSNIGIIDWDDLKCDLLNHLGEKIDGSSLVTYGTTKLMNVMIARELQRRVGDAGVLNYVVHPGITKTDIFNKMDRTKPGALGLEISKDLWGQPVERGARPMLFAATAPELDDPSKAGAYFGAFLGFTNLKQTEPREPFNPLSNDPEAAARLFDETEAIIAEALQKHGFSGPPAQGAEHAGAHKSGRRRDVNVGASVSSSAVGGYHTMHGLSGPVTGAFKLRGLSLMSRPISGTHSIAAPVRSGSRMSIVPPSMAGTFRPCVSLASSKAPITQAHPYGRTL